MYRLLQLMAVSAVLILFGIFTMLLWNGLRTFEQVSLVDFFFSSTWNPSAYGDAQYGILSMLISTLMVTFGAMLIAVPLGIGCAAYLSEMASKQLRNILKPTIELLAAIPSVAVGFIGIVLLSPFLARGV